METAAIGVAAGPDVIVMVDVALHQESVHRRGKKRLAPGKAVFAKASAQLLNGIRLATKTVEGDI